MDIDKIREIESKYPVETIRTDGFQVWPMIRFWLWAYYTAQVEPIRSKSSGLSIKQMLKLVGSLFYGLPNYFGKYNYLVFSDTSERRLIEGSYVDKSVDYITGILPKTLLVELPLPKHYPKSKIPTDRIVSKIPLYLLEWFYSKVRFTKIRIENEELLGKILGELRISFDYRSILIRNLAQHTAGKLLNRFYKPKGIVVQCAYTNTGFIKAFKDSGIPVIEVQHGLLSASHVAYNVFAKLEESYFPDYFLSYGHRERLLFSDKNFYIPKERVLPIGHYYLDMISSSDKNVSDYLPQAKKFKTLVCITGQNLPNLEQRFINFLKEAAPQCAQTFFAYIPRNRQSAIYAHKDLPANFLVVDDKDTYEIIRLSTWHTTMFSTCAIEALYLGTPNILINLDNLARVHYAKILGEGPTTQFVNTVDEFAAAVNSRLVHDRSEVITLNSDLIASGYRKNVENALQIIFNYR